MYNLSLNDKERQILDETLMASLNRLRDEISHTDTAEYRDELKDRRAILEKIKDQLAQIPPATELY